MIQIRKDSWHYRLYSRWSEGTTPPKDLCAYVRGILFSLVPYSIVISLATATVCVFGVSVQEDGWPVTFALFGLVAGILVFSAIMVAVIEKLPAVCQKTKEMGVVRLTIEYLKAKKHRYCPLVQVVDSKEKDRV